MTPCVWRDVGGCLQSLCGHLVISQPGIYDLLVAAVIPDIAEPLPSSLPSSLVLLPGGMLCARYSGEGNVCCIIRDDTRRGHAWLMYHGYIDTLCALGNEIIGAAVDQCIVFRLQDPPSHMSVYSTTCLSPDNQTAYIPHGCHP